VPDRRRGCCVEISLSDSAHRPARGLPCASADGGYAEALRATSAPAAPLGRPMRQGGGECFAPKARQQPPQTQHRPGRDSQPRAQARERKPCSILLRPRVNPPRPTAIVLGKALRVWPETELLKPDGLREDALCVGLTLGTPKQLRLYARRWLVSEWMQWCQVSACPLENSAAVLINGEATTSLVASSRQQTVCTAQGISGAKRAREASITSTVVQTTFGQYPKSPARKARQCPPPLRTMFYPSCRVPKPKPR
jgi:hypothetical protein